MQTNIPNTQRPISGSKPRKHITKINYDNPSLISSSVTALFKHPVALNSPIKIRHPPPSSITDSLTKAQHQFVLRKDRLNPITHQNSHYQTKNQPQSQNRIPLQRRYSTPTIMPLISNNNNKYNFMNNQVIKSKQNHGYNIINCYPIEKK